MGMIEDEYHFLLVCPSFSDIRRQCLPSYYSRSPSVTKFKTLMTESQSCVVKRLAKFVFLAMDKRKSILD